MRVFSASMTSLTLALNACPDRSYCLSNTSWQNEITYYTSVTISQRQATVVFSRANNTALDVQTISDPVPTNYTPLADFFPIYNVAMNVTSSPETLTYITSVVSQFAIGNLYDGQALLRQFIAVPVGRYNHPFPENQNLHGYLGIPTYRVTRFHFCAYNRWSSLLRLSMHLYPVR